MKHFLLSLILVCLLYMQSFAQCTVTVGADTTLCGTSATVYLYASVGAGVSDYEWVHGTGTFSPGRDVLNPVYFPSASEIASGTVVLVLNAIGCVATDTIVITLVQQPQPEAGPDQSICPGSIINLNGSVTQGAAVMWSTNNGTGVYSNTNSLNPTYTPSAGDIAAGTVNLLLTSDGNGYCGMITDTLTVTIFADVQTNAGPDQSICENNPVALNGTVSNTMGNRWSSSGTGTFVPNANVLNAVYSPSAADITLGSVMLTLEGQGICDSISDNLVITINAAPTVNAGPNQSLNAGGVTLSGSATNAAGVQWTSSGSGIFSNTNSLAPTYTPSAGDMTAGVVTLTLTAAGNGVCNPVSDDIVLTSHAEVCNVTIEQTVTGNSVALRAANDNSSNIGSYYWNFGDGTGAWGKVQDHVYSAAADYSVTVYFHTSDSLCSSVTTSTVSISSVPIATYSLSGTISAGGSGLDEGLVSLYKFNAPNYDHIRTDTVHPSDNGFYSFAHLENGSYLVYAIPQTYSSYFTSYLPTYFGDADIWEAATVINVNSNQSGKNINLIPHVTSDATWNTGSDSIKGVITFDASVAFRTTAASVNPVAFAMVLLLNSSDEILTYTYADAFGNYKFGDLIAGDYKLVFEYAGGYPAGTTHSLSVTVDGNSGTITNADTEILKETVTLGVNTKEETLKISMYPNPAAGSLNIELPESVKGASEVRIYNSLGEVSFKNNYNLWAKDNLSLNVQSLKPGIYIMELSNGGKFYRGIFIKN